MSKAVYNPDSVNLSSQAALLQKTELFLFGDRNYEYYRFVQCYNQPLKMSDWVLFFQSSIYPETQQESYLKL